MTRTVNRTGTWMMALLLGSGLHAAEVLAADAAPSSGDTAAVLGKLHHANQMEIEMGKMAQEKGQSKEVKAYGKTLVKDHTASDKKVMALAKEQKVDLAASAPAMPPDNMEEKLKGATGADFDRQFAEAMLRDHERDVSDAKAAQEKTTDPKLKKLLAATVPVLEKHRDTARKLVESTGGSAAAATAPAGAGTGAIPVRAGANPTAPAGGAAAPPSGAAHAPGTAHSTGGPSGVGTSSATSGGTGTTSGGSVKK